MTKKKERKEGLGRFLGRLALKIPEGKE